MCENAYSYAFDDSRASCFPYMGLSYADLVLIPGTTQRQTLLKGFSSTSYVFEHVNLNPSSRMHSANGDLSSAPR
ncbi:hypothetical protein KCU93_g10306, partial [Aureobasidium melanogenum]